MIHLIRCLLSSIKNLENRFWLPSPGNLSSTLELISQNESKVTLLQLGANDGVSNDPYVKLIQKYGWKGALVEPQPLVFQRLENYYKKRKHSLVFHNIAVAEKNGSRKMFYLDTKDQIWADGLTSFNKENIFNHINNGYIGDQLRKSGINLSPADQRKLIKEILIDCKTVENIIEISKLQNITILAMDLEGYDHVIINSLDLEKLRPKLIVYESKYVDFSYYRKTIKFLIKNNYKVFKDGQDIYALRNV